MGYTLILVLFNDNLIQVIPPQLFLFFFPLFIERIDFLWFRLLLLLQPLLVERVCFFWLARQNITLCLFDFIVASKKLLLFFPLLPFLQQFLLLQLLLFLNFVMIGNGKKLRFRSFKCFIHGLSLLCWGSWLSFIGLLFGRRGLLFCVSENSWRILAYLLNALRHGVTTRLGLGRVKVLILPNNSFGSWCSASSGRFRLFNISTLILLQCL